MSVAAKLAIAFAQVIGTIVVPIILWYLLRRFNLYFRWKARRVKLSELYDILHRDGFSPDQPIAVRTNADHSGTIHFGSGAMSWQGNRTRNRAYPTMWLAEILDYKVVLFRWTMPDIGGCARNIIVFSDPACSTYSALFGFRPKKTVRNALKYNVLKIAPNAYLDRTRVDKLLQTTDYLTLIEESGAKPVQHDKRGELYKFTNLSSNIEEPLVLVKFKDLHLGTDYVHRVPPDMTTATEAVAWMFYKRPEEYRPAVES